MSDETMAMPASGSAITGGVAPAQDEGRFLPGTLLGGRYRILNMLGKGGMGEVYRATDLTLGQSVALKFLPAVAASNPNLLERFHGEVRVARQVSHPNVCRVYDIGEADGMPYISMEYVDGEDFAALLTRIGRLPSEKALEIARKICAGLAAAHARGVIHRDLKPQNIMLNKRGEVLIMDFGLAAIADQMSGPEARNGTPAYMAPEQLKGVEVTARSDIYSLGLILYELFTGKKPFDAKTIPQLIAAQETTHLAGMTTLAGEIDPAIEKVIKACLHPEAARRPSSALGVAAALPGGDPLAAALAAGETPSPELVAATGKAEGMERGWALFSLAVAVTVALGSPVAKDRLNTLNLAPPPYAPAVLEQKAWDLTRTLGYPNPPLDQTQQLSRMRKIRTYLNQRPGPKDWSNWLRAEPELRTWYRESPEWLLAKPTGLELSSENPPPLEPGMVDLNLDAKGRLRNFDAVPYPDRLAEPVKLETVFAAAGLNLALFNEVESNFTPRNHFDERHEYRGQHPDLQGTELTVRIATYLGQVTHVLVRGPWDAKPQSQPAQQTESTFDIVRDILGIVVLAAGLVFAPLLALRNWKRGRADRKGALRVAIARFAVGLGYWAATVHGTPKPAMLGQFIAAVQQELLPAGMLWVLYLALEPALRAKWPHSIVTWNRVLAGKWNDPKVAAHVLIGCAAGCALWAAFTLRIFLLVDVDGPTMGGSLIAVEGTRGLVAAIFSRLKECLTLGLIGFFFLFGARTLLRRDWLAATVGAFLLPLIEGSVVDASNRLPIFAVYVLVYAAILFIMLRFGVIATMSTMFFLNLVSVSSMGLNLAAWWAPNGLLAIALLLLIAGWSFKIALGKRELLGGEHNFSDA